MPKGRTEFFRAYRGRSHSPWRLVSFSATRVQLWLRSGQSRRQPAQHLSRGFKESLRFRLAHFRYIFPNVMHQVIQHLFDVCCVMQRIAVFR